MGDIETRLRVIIRADLCDDGSLGDLNRERLEAANHIAKLEALIRQALDSRAPDYADVAHPGWHQRATAALST